MNEFEKVHVCGSSRRSGGRYETLEISGSGRFDRSVECDSFKVSGTCKIEDGDLTVHGHLSCSGSTTINGGLQAESARISGSLKTQADVQVSGSVDASGSLHVEGDFRSESLHSSGSFKLAGCAEADEMHISGSLKAGGDVLAKEFHSSGSIEIKGELSGELIEIKLNGVSTADSIKGREVRAFKQKNVFNLFSKQPRLIVPSVEAETVELEYTDADAVRGVEVHIGTDCVIGRVEYSGQLTVDPDAKVREQIKI